MLKKKFFFHRFSKYIIFFHLLAYAICFKNQWTYLQCKNYLNTLDIICYKITKKKDGSELCQKWNYKNTSSVILLPIECYNKKYNLNLILYNTDPPVKKKLIINLKTIEKTMVIDIKDQNNINFQNEDDYSTITKCINDFTKYEQNCILNKPVEEKKIKKCNAFKKKYINSKICFNIIKNFETNIESYIEENFSQLDLKDIEIDFNLNNFPKMNIDDNNNNIDFFGEEEDNNINYIDFEEPKEDAKSYFNNRNKKKYNDDNDNELENYYKNSRKDCVEYGLKSLKEDIIVCTKYE